MSARAAESPACSKRASTAVSTRLTKKDATDATRDGSPPDFTSESKPSRYASRTLAYMSSENMSVTLTLIPSEMSARKAGIPSGVAGTLIIALGLSSAANSRRASETVPAVSRARCGLTSSDAKPSAPPVESYTGRRMSAAARMSSIASASTSAAGSMPSRA